MTMMIRRNNGNDTTNTTPLLFATIIAVYTCLVYLAGCQGGMMKSNGESLLTEQKSRNLKANFVQRGEQQPFHPQLHAIHPWAIPQGEAQALPSLRVDDTAAVKARSIYGGKGDKQHLGGFTTYDRMGVSPSVWNWMLQYMGIKSVMDVGCGKGVSTLYFAQHGTNVLCLEGSHDAVTQSLLPDPRNQIVEHDFSRGPYWPAATYDAVWSVEFLEHVGRNFQPNYVPAFKKAAYLFVSHSKWGGWHHVEVHSKEWWITRMESFGFRFSQFLTQQVKQVALRESDRCKKDLSNSTNLGPDGKPYDAQHVWLSMMVFINPAVASLPQHAHLMAEPGCFKARKDGQLVTQECQAEKGETEMAPSFLPLPITPEMQKSWKDKVTASIVPSESKND